MLLGFTYADIAIIVVYLAIVAAIGLWARKRVRSKEDYFLGGRSFGKLVQTFAAFGQATSADGPVGVATTTYRNGASGIWSALMLVFATPIFWISCPLLRRLRLMTMGDFYAERYGSRRMAAAYALVATVGMMGLLSSGFTAVTKTAIAMTTKPAAELTAAERAEHEEAVDEQRLERRNAASLSPEEQARLRQLQIRSPRLVFSYLKTDYVIWCICAAAIMNAVVGGLAAAFYTDLLQGFLILVLSAILIPFSWARINEIYGGHGAMDALHEIHRRLPASFFQIFGSESLPDFTWYYIAAVAVVASLTVVTQPNQLVTNAAAKDEFTARVGMVTGSFIKRLCTIMWGITGLSAIILYLNTLHDSDLVWGHATKDLLGPAHCGLVGLMFVSLVAALMAASNSLMLTIAGLVINNLYLPLRPGKSEGHYVAVGRVAGAVFLIGGAFLATRFANLLQVLKFVWEFFVIFVAAFWLGIKWRRATRVGAWVSILGTLSAFYLVPLVIPIAFSSLRNTPFLLRCSRTGPITQVERAGEADIAARNREIADWDRAAPSTRSGVRPAILVVGQTFSQTFTPRPQSLFWSQGIAEENARETGCGYLYLDLVALDWLGVRFENMPYAVAETVRLSVRILVPFVLLLLVSLLDKSPEDPRVARFFIKMRIPVAGQGAAADEAALQAGYRDQSGTEAIKLFEGSSWELYRWNRRDVVGFFCCVGFVLLVLWLLSFSVSLGG